MLVALAWRGDFFHFFSHLFLSASSCHCFSADMLSGSGLPLRYLGSVSGALFWLGPSAASLAATSANLLPITPSCPGVHRTVNLKLCS
jgi:hypothetical protein